MRFTRSMLLSIPVKRSMAWIIVTFAPASCAACALSSPESPPPTTTTFLPATFALSGIR